MHAPTFSTSLTSPTVVRLHALPQALYIHCSGMQVAQSGNPLEGKLYDTLQHQVKEQNIILIPAYDMI